MKLSDVMQLLMLGLSLATLFLVIIFMVFVK